VAWTRALPRCGHGPRRRLTASVFPGTSQQVVLDLPPGPFVLVSATRTSGDGEPDYANGLLKLARTAARRSVVRASAAGSPGRSPRGTTWRSMTLAGPRSATCPSGSASPQGVCETRVGPPVRARLNGNLGALGVELTPDDLRDIESAASQITRKVLDTWKAWSN